MLCFVNFLKVVIHPDLEKKIIKLINDHRQEHADRGPVSGRITSKKLLVRKMFITLSLCVCVCVYYEHVFIAWSCVGSLHGSAEVRL